MGQVSTSPYTSQSISGYNSSPPPDDGTTTSSNRVEWAKHKTKLADPIKTLAEAIDTALVTAFAASINTATGVKNQISGTLGFAYGTATIGTDAITPEETYILVGTEGGATQDTLQVIETDNYYDGAIVWISQRNATEEVLVVDSSSAAATATGANLVLGYGDTLLTATNQAIRLKLDSSTWIEDTSHGPAFLGTATAPDGSALIALKNTNTNLLETITLAQLKPQNILSMTSSTTYTPSTGVTNQIVLSQGGGGGGGGSDGSSNPGGGGGAGAFSIGLLSLTPTATAETITIGAAGAAGAGNGVGGTGGTTSFGSTISTTGGAGGASGGAGGAGGSGGTGSGGDFNASGRSGMTAESGGGVGGYGAPSSAISTYGGGGQGGQGATTGGSAGVQGAIVVIEF